MVTEALEWMEQLGRLERQARDAATNPDDFDLKVKGIFSTGEMTWDTSSPGFVGAPSVGRLPGPAKRN